MVLMRVLARGLAAVSAATFLSVTAMGAMGCGAGLDKADADLRCDQEKAELSYFFDAQVYASCETCYEACGDSCVRSASSPISYSCDGLPTAGAGGSSTTSSTSTGK